MTHNDVIVSYSDPRAVFFRRRLATWGNRNRRDFPWRRTANPFFILLAEMMLRRTNAPQVVPVYLETIKRFPDPESLAESPLDKVLDVLKPLGLAWRAINIRRMCEVLVERFGGRIPRTYEELNELPGVGDYVASAVCSFAFNRSMPVIDTNTVRVVGRYFGFRTHAESRRIRAVRKTVEAVTSHRNTGNYNHSFLDFAATICKAIRPECSICPLRQHCVYGQQRLQSADA